MAASKGKGCHLQPAALFCDEEMCCFPYQVNFVLLSVTSVVVVLAVIAMLEQIFWDCPRRRKRVHARPPSVRDFEREHDVAAGRFPALAKVIEEQEKKDIDAGLDPKRKRDLDPPFDAQSGMESGKGGSQKGSAKAAPSSLKQASGKGAPPSEASLAKSGKQASSKPDPASAKSGKGLPVGEKSGVAASMKTAKK